MLWAQREQLLYLKLNIVGAQKEHTSMHLNTTHLIYETVSQDGTNYALTLPFFRRVIAETALVDTRGQYVQFTIQKKWGAPYWWRLFREPKGTHDNRVRFRVKTCSVVSGSGFGLRVRPLASRALQS